MEKVESKAVIEAILFAAGRESKYTRTFYGIEKPTEEIRNYNKRNARRL